MSEIYFFNTLTRKKEVFVPIKKGEVGIYSCGPTVYWYPHIGNMRAYIFADILKKVLKYNGYKVKHVINVTDVGHLTSDSDEGEDKIEKSAIREGKTAYEIAEFYFNDFKENMKMLNIEEPTVWCRATEHIQEQIKLIEILESKGYTYKTQDGIYFDSSKFKSYGKMARLNLEGLEAGKRVEFIGKKNKTDFALWKFSEKPGKRQMEWNSPWGLGFPGWHIECSAMSMKYLGEHFDIHTGGEDHIPVHHTNEIAQSEAATGKKFVNYWLHNAFLLFKGEKISKSKGGLYRLIELKEMGYDPLDFRYFALLTHYRKPLNFTFENLDAARNSLERLKRKVIDLKKEKHKGLDKSDEYSKKFLNAVNDDLNTPEALQVVWKMVDDFNFDSTKKIVLLEKFDDILSLKIKNFEEENIDVPEEIRQLLSERERLRKEKKWAEADIFRNKIKEKGFIIEDTPNGPKLLKAT